MGGEQEGLLGSWSQPGCSGEHLEPLSLLTACPHPLNQHLWANWASGCVEKLPGSSKAHGGLATVWVCS